jgi:hypothetical protein
MSKKHRQPVTRREVYRIVQRARDDIIKTVISATAPIEPEFEEEPSEQPTVTVPEGVRLVSNSEGNEADA